MVTTKQRRAAAKVLENIGSDTPKTQGQILIEAGYSEAVANHSPQQVTESKGFQELLAEAMPENVLLEKHTQLLNSTRLDHMVFPLEKPELTDTHITELLAEVNCKVRKIVHSETSRHVYFWAQDNKALKDALEMAYKLKGKFVGEAAGSGPVYNFFYKPEVRNVSVKYEQELEEVIEKGNVKTS